MTHHAPLKTLIGQTVKVRLPGETPWIEVIDEKIHQDHTLIKGRILNKLFREYSEHEQARWMKGEFDSVESLPELHKYKQGDEVWFEFVNGWPVPLIEPDQGGREQ